MSRRKGNMNLESRFATRAKFVADGHERALDGATEILEKRRTQITSRIEASFASQLAVAGFIRRIWLTFLMKRQIALEMDRELEELAPSDALYIKQP